MTLPWNSIAAEIEGHMIDADLVVKVLALVDEAAVTDRELVAAYPLLHNLLQTHIDAVFTAINPAIRRT